MKKGHQYILQNFDFGKVHKVMQALNWTWHGDGVPSVATIKQRASELLAGCNEVGQEVHEGGFSARCYLGELGHKCWSLEFVLESWESEWG